MRLLAPKRPHPTRPPKNTHPKIPHTLQTLTHPHSRELNFIIFFWFFFERISRKDGRPPPPGYNGGGEVISVSLTAVR